MIGQKGNPITDQKVWPRRNGTRLPTPAHLSDWSARYGLQPASGRPLRPEGLAKALLLTLTRVSDRGCAKPLLTALL